MTEESRAPNYKAGTLWICQIDGSPANEENWRKRWPKNAPPCRCNGCDGFRLAKKWEAIPYEAQQIIERSWIT